MNISQQTNGAHVAATNMTTLLQKNCIKTLSVNNGVVVMGTAPVGNASMINANVVPITSTPLTTNVTATNLQTHTMIANASHMQPIQAFQYQQLQAVSQSQPQYIIYNPSDGSMFRPVVSTAPVNAIVTNSLYQHQHHQPTIVAQNNLPKIGAIKATTLGANAQPKVLNIIAPHKHTIQQTTPTIQNLQNLQNTQQITNTVQHIKTENRNVSHQILHNGTNITAGNIINTTSVGGGGAIVVTSVAAASQIHSNTNQITTSAIHTQAIKSEALVTSSSIDSKAANNTINTNTQTSTNNTITTTHVNDTISKETHGLTPPTNQRQTRNDQQPAQTHPPPPPPPPEQPLVTNDNNEDENEPEPEIDIVINNVVCSFSVRCHLNLREIALNGRNVEFRRENGMVTMKLRRPYTTASIWSSGRITCTGATSEDQAKIGARRYARCLQGLGFPVRFNNFRVVNVLGTCSMPWAIKIVNFSEKYKKDASYEPELHPGVTYKLRTPKATLKIFSTGSITVTAGSVNDVQAAIEHIFPLVYEFRKKRTVEAVIPAEVYDLENDEDLSKLNDKFGTNRQTNGEIKTDKKKAIKRKYPFGMSENDPINDNMIVSDQDDLDDDDMDDL